MNNSDFDIHKFLEEKREEINKKEAIIKTKENLQKQLVEYTNYIEEANGLIYQAEKENGDVAGWKKQKNDWEQLLTEAKGEYDQIMNINKDDFDYENKLLTAWENFQKASDRMNEIEDYSKKFGSRGNSLDRIEILDDRGKKQYIYKDNYEEYTRCVENKKKYKKLQKEAFEYFRNDHLHLSDNILEDIDNIELSDDRQIVDEGNNYALAIYYSNMIRNLQFAPNTGKKVSKTINGILYTFPEREEGKFREYCGELKKVLDKLPNDQKQRFYEYQVEDILSYEKVEENVTNSYGKNLVKVMYKGKQYKIPKAFNDELKHYEGKIQNLNPQMIDDNESVIFANEWKDDLKKYQGQMYDDDILTGEKPDYMDFAEDDEELDPRVFDVDSENLMDFAEDDEELNPRGFDIDSENLMDFAEGDEELNPRGFDIDSENLMDFAEDDEELDPKVFDVDGEDLEDDEELDPMIFDVDGEDLEDDEELDPMIFDVDSEDLENKNNKFNLKVVASKISKNVDKLKEKLKEKITVVLPKLSNEYKVKKVRTSNDKLKLKKNLLKVVATTLAGATLLTAAAVNKKNEQGNENKNEAGNSFSVTSVDTPDTPDFVNISENENKISKSVLNNSNDNDIDDKTDSKDVTKDNQKEISNSIIEDYKIDSIDDNNLNDNIKIGDLIKVNDDGLIYSNMYDAVSKNNGAKPYFATDKERYVGGVSLNYNGNLVFIKYDDENAQEKINNLLADGASINSVVTINDNGYEGFFNVDDINILNDVYDEVINGGMKR